MFPAHSVRSYTGMACHHAVLQTNMMAAMQQCQNHASPKSAGPLAVKPPSGGKGSRPPRVAKMCDSFARHMNQSPAPDAVPKAESVELRVEPVKANAVPREFDIIQRGNFPSISLVDGVLVLR